MSFRDQPLSKRWASMGDEAEGVFERVYTQVVKQNFVRYGLDRAPINTSRISPFIRYSPDYLTARGLVEVQGFGTDQTFKMKLCKLTALVEWRQWADVHVFVYDSKFDEYAWVRVDDLQEFTSFENDFEIRTFPEGKAYYAIAKWTLPVTEEGWRTAPCHAD